MVLLIEKLAKLYTKMENHRHHRSYRTTYHDHQHMLELSLKNFQSHVTILINQVALGEISGSDFLSLSWIQKSFEVLLLLNKAFAKMVVDIDYPMSEWDDDTIDEYFKYSLSMLRVFNSINSSLSHLGQARLVLSHGLSMVESSPSKALQHLRKIQPRGFISKKFGEDLHREDEMKKIVSGKERILYQALTERNAVGCWISGVLLFALCSNSKPYICMKKMAGGFFNSAVTLLDCNIYELMEENIEVKEVKEINDAIDCLVSASHNGTNEAAIALHRKLETFEKQLDDLGREVDNLFQQVLAERNGLIDCFRHRKN